MKGVAREGKYTGFCFVGKSKSGRDIEAVTTVDDINLLDTKPHVFRKLVANHLEKAGTPLVVRLYHSLRTISLVRVKEH